MLHLDGSLSGDVAWNDEGEVFKRVERVANCTLALVLSDEKNFAQVCRWRWAGGRSTGDDANYEADF